MDNSEDEKSRRRLICLDTESSICLSFDKSTYDNVSAGPSNSSGNMVNSNMHKMTQNNYPMSVSSENQFVPRIRQINGSNDSQHYEDARSISSNDQSMTTADMIFSEDDNMFARRRYGNADLDLELQAAVDQMLQGTPSPVIRPYRPFYFGRRQIAFASESPESLGDSEMLPKPSIPQRVLLQGRLLYAKMAGAFARRRVPSLPDDSVEPRFEEVDDNETKQQTMDGRSSAVEKPQGKCAECMGRLPQTDVAPSRMARMLAPIVQYMQRRPMAALGIILGALVALLVVIVIILVVCVLPFLISSTLEDVSFTVTSFHAIAPAPVSRALSLKKLTTSLSSADSSGHDPHLHEEVDLPVSDFQADSENHGLRKREIVSLTPHSLVPTHTNTAKTIAKSKDVARHIASFKPQLKAAEIVPHATNAIHNHPSPTALSSNDNRIARHAENVVTITHTSMSIIHLTPNSVTPAQDAAIAKPTNINKAHDAEVLPMTYTMQVAGNLTSGGPIGIDIEFTEPLRMYWRDAEVGTIKQPELIRVPGRGTAQWKWPPFEVSIPHAPLIASTSSAHGNKKLVIPHKEPSKSLSPESLMIASGSDRVQGTANNAFAQRSALGGNMALERAAAEQGSAGNEDGLSDWFAAIQAHRSFTMQWKSHVRASGMGMHSNNVKFEKTVHIVCAVTKDCVVSG
ncbi:hypothetical protein COEREDRAFT_13406 [Coemansia reversa NRRL 1564]|uniref:Uncharacterized protein n=1 Tax=Coemansia reversa (strain ATCC 12441 / NRRL 1564) TaxID=763665 RepID=A0A2G5BJ69_COERN|nr:hypothetical protein COEREDRAFT_13406 [Coemansia reversa NRRL 1564]|eukprot:PIA18797.1 hypothetical protein COEREDRAFT_13406 [Coemansia reversa NRRL 1564]